jgi:hypothetical protein
MGGGLQGGAAWPLSGRWLTARGRLVKLLFLHDFYVFVYLLLTRAARLGRGWDLGICAKMKPGGGASLHRRALIGDGMKNGRWFCLMDRVSGRSLQAFSTLSQSCAIAAMTAKQLAVLFQLFGIGDAVKAMLLAKVKTLSGRGDPRPAPLAEF